MKPIVIVPTYNEQRNVGPLLERVAKTGIPLDLLFVDDNSPDGTGALLDDFAARMPNLQVLHRSRKEGIGAAHQAGLAWAIEHGYECVVTMDCDLTHSPEDIPLLLKASESADVVVGSRYLRAGSLSEWNLVRKSLTLTAHVLTELVLGVGYDCTGAFRVYRMDRLPEQIFSIVRSKSYSFFFESLYVLHCNGARIAEVPINLPARTYGSSKMSFTEPFRSVRLLLETAARRLTSPETFRLPSRKIAQNPAIEDAQGWDDYWKQSASDGNLAYKVIASLYRRAVISRRLAIAIRQTFPRGAKILHAGCGSGQVDVAFENEMRITALDSSLKALQTYARTVFQAEAVIHGTIFQLPFADRTFDGIYNLGVMEHFEEREIVKILAEFRRVLKPQGRLLMFWPHARATSVAVLRLWQGLRNRFSQEAKLLHPAEISLARGKAWMKELLLQGGFSLESYSFNGDDLWVQVVVVAAPLP